MAPTEQAGGQSYRFAFAMITTLFFMWGFVHNLDPILIPHLRKAFSLTVLQSALVDSAVFIAYFVMALPAGLLIRKTGYKTAMLCGLGLFAFGALLFVPAAQTQRYAFVLGALFIIACGLTVLETAANPYVTFLGAPEKSEQRLNLSQSFNGLGSFVGPLIGGALFFADGGDRHGNVQATYVAIAAVVALIAVLIARTPMPDIRERTVE